MNKRVLFNWLALSAASCANPVDLSFTKFSESDLTPSPACLSVAATGEVFVGVDLLGSLGKGPNKGSIVRIVDQDQDGKADSHTVFAAIDNPRGLISMGDKLYVLHTVIPSDTGILTGMHLSMLEDKNRDGVADGPAKMLVKDISVMKHNQDRGADHTTNGISMGIDGWIYISVGDFGFVDATGTDGKKLTMLGGGLVRVRPDGTDMEIYTHGTRNVYDVAIDPQLNIYTRENTNDGGGWNVRFSHHIQSGEYGYPTLFKNFANEILPALEDLGGGSGTGALFLDEPNWPKTYNRQPLMADWGRNQIFLHRLEPDGASFTQKAENFIGISQPSDLDVDGSGRLYIAAWAGAGYTGSPQHGFIQRVVPNDWTYTAFPDLTQLEPDILVKGLDSPSAVARLATQQEILRRNEKDTSKLVLSIARDENKPVFHRIAAIFTYKQLLGSSATPALLELTKDDSVREFALRALTDRLSELDGIPLNPFLDALKDGNPRTKAAAAVSLGRLGKTESAAPLLASVEYFKLTFQSDLPTTPLFASTEISGEQTADIDISVEGIRDLYLVVEEAGNGNGGDHAGWFDPTLTNSDGKKIPLTEYKWQSAKQGWATTEVNKTPGGTPLKRADGKPVQQGIGTHARSIIHYVIPSGMQRLTVTAGLCDTKGADAVVIFKLLSKPPYESNPDIQVDATPNASIILPHLAVQSLVRMKAADTCLDALDSNQRDVASWALRLMHESAVVDGLLGKFASTQDPELKNIILSTLSRLYTRETPYDGSWWWGTKPDSRGPYYKPITWEKSPEIESFFRKIFEASDVEGKARITTLANLNRMNLEGIGEVEKIETSKEPTIGEISIEDVILSLDKMNGDPTKGSEILKTQSCVACHSIGDGNPERGPSLNRIGAHLNRAAIAEAILKPDASIAESWVDVTLKDGSVLQGTLVEKTDNQVTIRDIAGVANIQKTENVVSVKTSSSTLMGPHLVDSLTMPQFADVIAYLHSLK